MYNLTIVIKIWSLAIRFLLTHYRKLAQFILPPIVFLALIGVIVSSNQSLFVIGLIGNLALYVMFAVAWHKFILAPDTNKTIWQYLAWGKDKWRYLLVLMLTSFIIMIIMTITIRPRLWLMHSLNSMALWFTNKPIIENLSPFTLGWIDLTSSIALLILFIPLSRLIMLFPAAAVEQSISINSVWKLSQQKIGFCFTLFITLAIAQVLFGFSGIALRYTISEILGSGSVTGETIKTGELSIRLIDELIWQSFNYLTIAISITPLSFAYKTLQNLNSKN